MRAFEIKKIAESQRKGTYMTITTSTEPRIKAATKKAGIQVRKVTTKTIRLGCNYNNMASVIEAKENGRGTRNMYEAPIIDNILYENTETGQMYLRVGNVPNNNVKTSWLVNGNVVSLDEAKEYIQPSYFNGKGTIPEVQNVKIENIISLGKAI